MTSRARRPQRTQTSAGKAAKLRIIGGEWRSRQLPIPELEGLRPTPDRVRETLFNWITAYVPGARCADLFCGSGALGLEALSREAASCVFVDASAVVTRQMVANLKSLNCQTAEVVQQSAVSWLQSATKQPFDLVFLDPPFRKGWLEQIIPLLADGWLSNQAWVYIEMEKEADLQYIPDNWHLHREKTAGQLCYRLFQVS